MPVVCQSLFREPGALADELLAGTEFGIGFDFRVATAIESACGLHDPVCQVEGQKGFALVAAAHHEAIPSAAVPDIFDLILILVGPAASPIISTLHITQ